MLLQDPRIFSRFNPEKTDKMPAILLPQPATIESDWTPPPYWKSLLQIDESKFEQECKKWFARAMVLIILTSIFLLSCIFLFKLIMLVINLK